MRKLISALCFAFALGSFGAAWAGPGCNGNTLETKKNDFEVPSVATPKQQTEG